MSRVASVLLAVLLLSRPSAAAQSDVSGDTTTEEADAAAGPAAPDGGRHSTHGGAGIPDETAITGQSIYQLDAIWQDQDGHASTLADLAGQPVVLAMVYTHCEAACPRIIGDMRQIAKDPAVDAERVHFVLVSIDPARDTVERLAAFAAETGLAQAGWRLLRGSSSDVRALAAVLGVQYRRVGEVDYAHSNLISVLNARGEVVYQQQGLGVDPTRTVAALADMASPRDR